MIKAMGWSYLLFSRRYQFYIPNLVRDFYDGFKVTNFDLELGKLQIIWRGVDRIISIENISALINIPLKPSATHPHPIIEYVPIIGPRCEISLDHEIHSNTTYINVYVACRWACNNIMGTFKSSAFYGLTLAMVHALMIRGQNFM